MPKETPESDDTASDFPAPDAANNPRLAAMERLSGLRAQEINDEIREAGGNTFVERDEVTPTPTDDDGQPPADDARASGQVDEQVDSQTETPPDDPPELTPDMLKARVKVKIDGQEEWRTVEQLQRDAQLDGAARRRFDAAAKLLQDAQAEADRRAQETPGKNTTSPTDAPSSSDETIEQAKAVLGKLFEGDEDAAAEGLARLLTKAPASAPAPAIDEAAITDAVTRRIEQQQVLHRFYGKYQAIARSPGLQSEVAQELNQMDADTSFEQALEQAAQAVYGRLGLPDPTTSPPEPEATSRRAEEVARRKESLAQQPRSRSVSSTSGAAPVESSEQNRSSTIAQMAASRRPPPRPA